MNKRHREANRISALAAPPKPKPEIIFDAPSNLFYIRHRSGDYIYHRTEGLRRYLKSLGFNPDVEKSENLSEIDELILEAENNNRVDLVGEFAGYREAKIYTVDGGNRLLMPSTKGINRIVPAKGKYTVVGDSKRGPESRVTS